MTEIIVLRTALVFSPVCSIIPCHIMKIVMCYFRFNFLRLFQYAGPVHLGHGALVEEDKVGPFVMPDQVPSPHGIPQVVTPAQAPSPSPSPSPFSLNQVLFLFNIFEVLSLFHMKFYFMTYHMN